MAPSEVDPELAEIADKNGLPYDVVEEAMRAEELASNEKTWRIADLSVKTAVLAMRHHRAQCGLRDCAGGEWEKLIGSFNWEQLAVAFAAATQMLMEHLPEFSKEELRAEATTIRPEPIPSRAEWEKQLTTSIVDRAKAILADRKR